MDEPRWEIARTLLGCATGHDVNRRSILFDERTVVTFNRRMAEWHPEDDEALRKLVAVLNAHGVELRNPDKSET